MEIPRACMNILENRRQFPQNWPCWPVLLQRTRGKQRYLFIYLSR